MSYGLPAPCSVAADPSPKVQSTWSSVIVMRTAWPRICTGGNTCDAGARTHMIVWMLTKVAVFGANPIGACGLIRLIEGATQVMGKSENIQIKDAKLALVQSGGGWANLRGCAVLGA